MECLNNETLDERKSIGPFAFKIPLASVIDHNDDEKVVMIDKPLRFENNNWNSRWPKNRRMIEESKKNECRVLDKDLNKVFPDPR